MIQIGGDYEIQSYKSYKGNAFQKHIDKTNKQLWAIKQSSLKPEDKEVLRNKLIDSIQNFKLK